MNDRPGYGETEAKRIIERAAEIDAERVHRVNVPALREIAAEAGISALAIDRAIQEHESASVQVPSWKRYRTLLITAAIVAGLLLYAFLRRVVAPQ
ncbi:MAG: hypothetical protein ACT4P6_18585 [Gemmatimonadaceae bacterium]